MPGGMEVFDADGHIGWDEWKQVKGSKVKKTKPAYSKYDTKATKKMKQTKLGLKDRAPYEEGFNVDADNELPVRQGKGKGVND